MEYTYATLLLNESDQEINERNLTAVLEAAGAEINESRIKAIVAALEGVDLDKTVDTPDAERVASGESDPGAFATGESGGEAEAVVPEESESDSGEAGAVVSGERDTGESGPVASGESESDAGESGPVASGDEDGFDDLLDDSEGS